MIHCKICLEDAHDIVPASSCVRGSIEYINLNQHLVERTLQYVRHELHLERCQLVKRTRIGDKSYLFHLSELQKTRLALRTVTEHLLGKRRKFWHSRTDFPGNTEKPFLCPGLMPFYIGTTAATLDIVEASLAAMDERLNTECGNFSSIDADDPQHLLPSVVTEFKKVSKVAHLSKLHAALQRYDLSPLFLNWQSLMNLDM